MSGGAGGTWMGQVGGSALAGMGFGAALGPPGMAAGAVAGGLVGLARNLFPETVGGLLDGPRAAQAAPLIEQVMRDVTGTAAPGAAMESLAADPVKELEIKARLADVWVQMDRIAAEDRRGARDQTVRLAQAGSPLAWGAAVVTLTVLAMFSAFVAFAMLRGIPPGMETLAIRLETTLEAMALAAVFYWLGSSRGSANKDERLAATRGDG